MSHNAVEAASEVAAIIPPVSSSAGPNTEYISEASAPPPVPPDSPLTSSYILPNDGACEDGICGRGLSFLPSPPGFLLPPSTSSEVISSYIPIDWLVFMDA